MTWFNSILFPFTKNTKKTFLRKISFITVFAALLCQMIVVAAPHAHAQKKQAPSAAKPSLPPAPEPDTPQLQSKSITVASKATVNVRALATQKTSSATQKSSAPKNQAPALQTMPVPGSIP